MTAAGGVNSTSRAARLVKPQPQHHLRSSVVNLSRFTGYVPSQSKPIRSKLSETREASLMKKETAEIVSAYVGHNSVSTDQLPALISSVSEALSMLGGLTPAAEEPLTP